MAKPIHLVTGKKLTISHWDNEVSLDLEYLGNESTNMYVLTDGFEYEVVLDEKPVQNEFRFRLEKRGLDFFYQPALTQAELDEGAIRPENVIGSYAVYHSTKKNNKYKTGKVCHIYRPKAHDANGVEQWCEMDITGTVLKVTVPQEFLDTAVYPVIVDPTFGYTTIGGSESTTSPDVNQMFIGYDNGATGDYDAPENGNVTSISYYSLTSATVRPVLFGAYNSGSDNFPLETYGDEVTMSATSWTAMPVTESAITSGLAYSIAIWCNTNNIGYKYDTKTGDSLDIASATYHATNPPPNDPQAGGPTASNRRLSIYATYTATGGATRRIFNIS